MKKTIPEITIAMLAALCFLLAPAFHARAAEANRIGVIDFQRFLMESDLGKAAQAEIESEGLKMESDLQERAGRIEEMKSEIERDAMVMDEEKREEKEREYKIKILDLRDLQEKYKKNFQELEQRLIGRIQKEAMSLAEELGRKEGFVLLIEKNAVVYHPEAVDATDKLIELSNERELKLKDVRENGE